MTAYVVAHVKFRDASRLKGEYVYVTARLEEQFGGRHIASGIHKQVEGDGLGTVTSILEFPSIEAVEAFWNHPEYQRVAAIRRAGSDSKIVIIDAAEVQGPFASVGRPEAST